MIERRKIRQQKMVPSCRFWLIWNKRRLLLLLLLVTSTILYVLYSITLGSAHRSLGATHGGITTMTALRVDAAHKHLKSEDAFSQNQGTNCNKNLDWMTEPMYLNQLKSLKPNCRQGGNHLPSTYQIECDSELETYIKRAEERIRNISQSLGDMISEKLHNLFFTNLTAAGRWKVLNDMLHSCGYEQRLPDVICIGVKKSGTSIFADLFSKHPQIASPLIPFVGSEVHFFDWNYDKGVHYYQSRMGFASHEMISFEKTPKYFRTKDAPYNIKKDLPKHIKFIFVVKDPIKRSISEFRHESVLALNPEREKILLENRTEQTEGIRFEKEVLLSNGKVNINSEIIDTSLYSKHFQNWLQYYPREKFFIINYDEMVQNVSLILQKVESFLGLRSYFQNDMFKLIRKNLCFIPHSNKNNKAKDTKICPTWSKWLPKGKPSNETLETLCRFFQPYNEKFMRLANMIVNWKCS